MLRQLAESEGDILENIELIENLEKSKKLSIEITEKVEIAKTTEIMINDASEAYRPAASRGALVYFLMNELYKIHSFYRFSLDSFIIVVNRAIDLVAEKMRPKKVEPEEGEEAEPSEPEDDGEMSPRTLKARVDALTESITFEGFNYTRRGTFEKHKLIVATMLTFRINVRKGLIKQDEVDALVKKEVHMAPPTKDNKLEFIPESAWGAVKALENVPVFSNLIMSMEGEALQWRKWYGENEAEVAELARSFKDLDLFHRLLLLRALRPDRLSGALKEYCKQSLGEEYVEQPSFDIFKCFPETNAITPIFFVLFPGVDPTSEVEKVGASLGKYISDNTLNNISMGQGQEKSAIAAL